MTTISDVSMYLVSVVVPVYNAENYLHKFLISIQDQEHKNLEVILVDDGSTDSSLEICRCFSFKDKRFLVKTKENAGVASARSVGNKLAKGDFLIHFDPDDTVPKTAVHNMLEKLVKESSDLCIGNYLVKYPRVAIPKKVDKIYDSFDMVKALAAGDAHGSLCNKLIKRSLVEGVDFYPGIDLMEDKIFLIKLLINNPSLRFSYLDEIVYCYYQRAGSYTNSRSSLERFKSSTDVVLQLVTDVTSSSELSLIRSRARLIAILDSGTPHLEYRPQDLSMVKEHGIPWHYRIAVYLLSKKFVFPFKMIQALRASRRRYLGLFP